MGEGAWADGWGGRGGQDGSLLKAGLFGLLLLRLILRGCKLLGCV